MVGVLLVLVSVIRLFAQVTRHRLSGTEVFSAQTPPPTRFETCLVFMKPSLMAVRARVCLCTCVCTAADDRPCQDHCGPGTKQPQDNGVSRVSLTEAEQSRKRQADGGGA